VSAQPLESPGGVGPPGAPWEASRAGDGADFRRQMAGGLALRVSRYPLQAAFVLAVPPVLGAEAYGAYATCVALFALVAEATDLGTLPLFGRFVPGLSAEAAANLARQLLWSRLAIGLVGGSAVLALLWTPRPEDPLLFILVLAAILVVPVQQVLFGRLYARGQIARLMARDPLRSGLSLALVIPGYLLLGLAGAVGALLVAQLLLVALGTAWVRPAAEDFAPPRTWQGLEATLRFGLAASLPTLLVITALKLGTPLLSRLGRSGAEVASFDLAVQAFALLWGLAQYPYAALLPRLGAAVDAGRAGEARRVLRDLVGRVATGCALGVVALVAVGDWSLRTLLGPGFASLYGNLVLVVGGGVLPMLVTQAGLALGVLEKRPGRAVLPAALLAAVTAVATLILGGPFGAPVACLGLAGGLALQAATLAVRSPGLGGLVRDGVGAAAPAVLGALALGLLEAGGGIALEASARGGVLAALGLLALLPVARAARRRP
jgi:O-antigen/teichoic acid export membrane protein